jgi:hypothetical protein
LEKEFTGKGVVKILMLIIVCALFFMIGRYSMQTILNEKIEESQNHDLLLRCGLEEIYADLKNNLEFSGDTCDVLKVKSAVQEIYGIFNNCDTWADSVNVMTQWLYRRYSPSNSINPKVAIIDRKQSWQETLADIRFELHHCSDWFDTVNILSTWLYQNTRVGNPDLDLDMTFGKENLDQWYASIGEKDAKWFYDVNNSDSVVSNCGSHCYFATRMYGYFNIKSYHLSIKGNLPQSEEGHMINVLLNPHDRKWYPIDHFFGIRWTSNGRWLDMETYMQLSKKDMQSIDAELFATYKFHIYGSPFNLLNSWSLETIEIASVEAANYKNYFRVVAPYTLRRRFASHKPWFDSIAATCNQAAHIDWQDLARRMPMYGEKLFSPPPLKEQHHADALLARWKKQ